MTPYRIRCYHFNQAFRVAFHSPQTKREHADSVIIRIDFRDGTSGFGESAPRPYVTGENCHSVVDLITNCFASILFDYPIDTISSIQNILEKLETTCLQKDITAYNSALGAIDLALLDALERSRRIAPDQLFSAEPRDALRSSVSVPFLPQDMIHAYFPLFKRYIDMSVLKILVSEDADETYERVKLIRRLADPDSELRLEFNGKMTLTRVQDLLKRLKPFMIKTVEQPLPPGHLEGLQKLRAQFDLDLVADESLVTLKDAERLAHSGAYSIFNIKVSKCGGLLQSQRIAQLADRHGILCQVGTHVGESQLLGTAGQRLARHLPNFDCYGGGSDILFSRLLENRTPPLATRRFSGHHDPVPIDTCLALVAKCRLLADTVASTPDMSHANGVP